MNIYFSVTREPAEPRGHLTPVAAVHVGIPHEKELGVRTFKGESLWEDLHADLTKICGASQARQAPTRTIVPTGWEAGLQFGIIMTNFFRKGLSFYRYMQPTFKKWQDATVCDLSRIFTQCAWIKDVTVDEKDAFEFMGLGDKYYSENDRYECVMSGDPVCEQGICQYMEGLREIYCKYVNLNYATEIANA